MLGSKRATTCCDPQYAAAQHGSTAEFLAVPGVIPIPPAFGTPHVPARRPADPLVRDHRRIKSEEHTYELQSLMRISYAVFCLKKTHTNNTRSTQTKTQR